MIIALTNISQLHMQVSNQYGCASDLIQWHSQGRFGGLKPPLDGAEIFGGCVPMHIFGNFFTMFGVKTPWKLSITFFQNPPSGNPGFAADLVYI